jgi:hypothetical protein
MKIHLAWNRATAVAALAVVGLSGHLALGQYAPYGAAPQPYAAQQPYAGQSQYAAPQQQPYPNTQPQQTAAYGTPGYGAPAPAYNSAPPARPTAYVPPAQQPSYMVRPQQQPVAQYQQQQQPAAQYQQQQPMAAYPQTAMRPNYPYVAQNNGAPTPTATNESLPTPAPINGGNMSGPAMNGSSVDSSTMGGSNMGGAPVSQGYEQTMQGYGGGCSTCGAGGAGGYPATGGCGDYGYMNGTGCGQPDYGIGNYFDRTCGGRAWFGGVYYLFMDRTNPSNTRLATAFDTTSASYPYYPPKRVTILETNDAEDGFRSGAEIRFGSTFSIGTSCDTCNSGCGGYGGGNSCGGCNACETQDYAWEAAWWAIDKDVTSASYTLATPAGPKMIFGMKNFAGEQYDRAGGGMMPVNNYLNYGIPVPAAPAYPTPNDGDVRIRTVSERTSFSAQNIELNFLRLPMVCGGCAPTCDTGCGGCGDCGVGGGCGCAQPSCGSAFTITGLCGIRFFRIDDDFRFADTFYVQTTGAPGADGNIYFDRSVDNLMTGFQWGANMNYCVCCRWNLFCDTDFGIYDNHMRVFQQFTDSDGGQFNDPTFRSTKDDVAFLGELRIGGAYDISCHWRAVAAYRAVAISGLALSTDLPSDFADHADANHINSDNSVLIHGIQVGFECRY